MGSGQEGAAFGQNTLPCFVPCSTKSLPIPTPLPPCPGRFVMGMALVSFVSTRRSGEEQQPGINTLGLPPLSS